jgi:amino acid transporter
MAGANLSGDLREPSKSIPKGTLLGVSFTFAVYFTLFLLTGLTCDRVFLNHDCLYMSELEFWKPFVSIGALVNFYLQSLQRLFLKAYMFVLLTFLKKLKVN